VIILVRNEELQKQLENIHTDLTSLRNEVQEIKNQQHKIQIDQMRNETDSRYMFVIGALGGFISSFYVSFAMEYVGNLTENQIIGGLIVTGLILIITAILFVVAEWLRKKDRDKQNLTVSKSCN
jgi:hypothetical protein